MSLFTRTDIGVDRDEIALNKAVLAEAVDLVIVSASGEPAEDVDAMLREHGQEGTRILAERANYDNEIKKIRVTRDQKLRRLVQRTSVLLAKMKGDPLYSQWRKHRQEAEKVRLMIEKKYRGAAMNKAKEVVTNAKRVAATDLPDGAGNKART
jgi:hypothetical protein